MMLSAACAFGSASELSASNGAQAAPGLWDVDISMRGTQCLAQASDVTMWRTPHETAARFRSYGPANSPSATLEFEAGGSIAQLDTSAFPIMDGSSMTISDKDGNTIGQIDFAIVEGVPDVGAKLVEVLRSRGCEMQLKRTAN